MIKRLVSFLFFCFIGLIVAGLIAPSFIDWNQHKAKILAQLSPYLQRKIDVAGDVSFSLVPQPQMRLEQVTVANAAGAQKPLLTLKMLEARVRVGPLLEGRIEIETVTLVDPVLNLEIMEDGKANWSGILTPSGGNAAIPATAVQLNEMAITGGTINYFNHLTGSKRTVDRLNLTVAAGTLLGPYRVKGDLAYRDIRVNVEAGAGAYDRASAAPLTLSLKPVEKLPQVDLQGALDLQSGLDIQGELSITNGKLASLLNLESVRALRFMNDPVDLKGVMEFKGNQFSLSGIKAKFGQKGSLQGKMTAQFSRQAKPAVMIDVEGANLAVTDKGANTYMDVPRDFEGSMHFKGKNIIWAGQPLSAAEITTTFNQKEWTIKSGRVNLPGASQINFAGVVTPTTEIAAYTSIQIKTEDMSKLVQALGPASKSAFQALGTIGLIKKFSMTGKVNLSPVAVGFSDIDAKVNDKLKISGALIVERTGEKPGFSAKLHLTDWNGGAFSSLAYSEFLKTIMRSNADLELTAENYTRNGISAQAASLKAKTDDHGLAIQEATGVLSDNEGFTFKGRVAALAPAAGLEIAYTLKAAQPGDIAAAFGIDLPPALANIKNSDISGTVKSEADKTLLTVEGSAGEMTLHGQRITSATLLAEVTPGAVTLPNLKGTVWGGKLDAQGSFARNDTAWSSTLKGSLKQAELQQLADKFGFKGFTLGSGNIDFDMKSPASGAFGVTTSSLTVEKFNFDKLGEAVQAMKMVPADLSGTVADILHGASSVFKDVQASFTAEGGKINFKNLKLDNAAGVMTVSGKADAAENFYDIVGDLQLKKPENFPPLKITRASDMQDYKVDVNLLEKFIADSNPPPTPPPIGETAAPVPLPEPARALPPEDMVAPPPAAPAAPEGDGSAIPDILKRLDDAETETPPASEPAALP